MLKLPVNVRTRWGMTSLMTFGAVAAIILVVELITILDIRRERSSFHDQQEEKGLLLATQLNDMLARHLYFLDVDALRDAAENIVESEPAITYVEITDSSGELLAGTREGGSSLGSSKDELRLRTIRENKPNLVFEGNNLSITSPVMAGRELVGVLKFEFGSEALSTKINSIFFEHLWQGLAMVAAVGLIAFIFAWYAARPLRLLSIAAVRIGRGDLDTIVPIRGTKETAELGSALNQMRVELNDLYQDLERRVEERTDLLASTLQQLRREVAEREQAEEDRQDAQVKALVLSQLGFGNCLRKRLRLLPFFRSVDVGGWQPWDENGMWSGWKGKNETSWND